MTISVFVAVTGCPADKRAEVVSKSKTGVEATVATLGYGTNVSTIVYDGQDIIVREIDAVLEPANVDV